MSHVDHLTTKFNEKNIDLWHYHLLSVFLFQKMADKLYGIHKVHANYSRVYCEWSGIEKEMADPLQSAGHYMNV